MKVLESLMTAKTAFSYSSILFRSTKCYFYGPEVILGPSNWKDISIFVLFSQKNREKITKNEISSKWVDFFEKSHINFSQTCSQHVQRYPQKRALLSTFEHFWALLSTSEHFWALLSTFEHFWALLSTFDWFYRNFTIFLLCLKNGRKSKIFRSSKRPKKSFLEHLYDVEHSNDLFLTI